MALYPIKVMLDERRNPFIPFMTADAITINDSEQTVMDMFNDRYTKEEVDQIIRDLGTLQRLCGRVDTVADLPANPNPGDTYIVGPEAGTNNSEYMYIGTKWEELGPMFDYASYYTKTQIDLLLQGISGNIPTTLSQLSDDSTHRTVTDTEKNTWNAKSNFSGSYNDLTDKPTIPTVPTNVSAFINDAGYLTQHQDISGKLDASAVKTTTNTTQGNVYDVTYINTMLGDIETLLGGI